MQSSDVGLARSAARGVLAFAVAAAVGAATDSLSYMLGAFAATVLALNVGGRMVGIVGSTTWGEKPIILALALVSSVKTAAMAVAAFGVLVAGHVTLNLVLGDIGLRQVDVVVGVIPFIGIVAYSVLSGLDGGMEATRRHPVRSLTRGVAAAGMAAVILYMAHAVMHVTGFVAA